MNQFKKIEEPIVGEKISKVKPKKKSRFVSSFLDVINGSFLTRESAIKLLPFLFYLTFIGLLYIANGYYSEDTVRAINTIGTELKELKTEYIITKSELMFNSKQSQVAKDLELLGIKESVVPPKKIVIVKNKKTE